MGQHRQPSLSVDELRRLKKVPGVRWSRDEQPQQVAQLGGHLNARDNEEILKQGRGCQRQIVVADGRAVEALGLFQSYNLLNGHRPVRRPLGMDVQV